MKLDLTNLKIIDELQYNAKIPDSALAKKLNISREVLAYRIKKLEETEIIKGYTTIINTAKLGYIMFRIFIKMKNMSKQHEEELIHLLKNKVIWLVRARGNWSYNLIFQVKKMSEINEFIKDLQNKFSQNIINMQTAILTKIIHSSIQYTDEKKNNSEKTIILNMEDQEKIDIDTLDREIISELTQNARIPNTKIAIKLNQNERVIRYRIKKLEEQKIILGYRTTLNNKKLEKNYYKIHLTLTNKSTKTINDIKNYLKIHKNTAYITETIGGWDIELETISTNQETYKLIDDLEEKFPQTLQDYEILEYEKEYKLQYLSD